MVPHLPLPHALPASTPAGCFRLRLAADCVSAAMGDTAPDLCCLCRRPADPAALGGLGALHTAIRAPKRPNLRYHEACAGYSSGIAYGRRTSRGREPFRAGEIPANRVAAEEARGAQLRCAVCNLPGATLGCRGIDECKRSWHLPCARSVAQAGGGVVFSSSVMECACAQHAARCGGISMGQGHPSGAFFLPCPQ